MGTPTNPEQGDVVTLYDADGKQHGFMVVWVDEELVICDSGARIEHFTRDQFAGLFGEGASDGNG